MSHTLATAGNSLALPFVYLVDEGHRADGLPLVLHVSRRGSPSPLPGDTQLRLTRAEAKLVARCILDALDFPEDGE